MNSASYATHKQLSDHSVKTFEHFSSSRYVFQAGTASDERLCPKGHKCEEGSPSATPCEPGTFQDNEGMSECIVCQVKTISLSLN